MDFTKAFRLSIVTFTSEKSGDSLKPSVSLSKAEVKKLGGIKKNKSFGTITLDRLWNRIGRNQFCLTQGSLVNSKTTLSDYYNAAFPHYSDTLKDLAKLAEGPVLTIAYREKTRVPSPQKAGDAPFDLTLHTFDSGLPAFGAFPDDPDIDPNDIATNLPTDTSRPAQMSVGQWNEVLVNNSLLNGFFVDHDSQELFRARRTAFKLEPNPINPFLFSPGTLSSDKKTQIRAIAQTAAKQALVSPVELGPSSQSKSKADQSPSKGSPKGSAAGSNAGSGTDSDTDSDAGSDAGSDTGSDTSKSESDPDLPADEPLDNLYPLWEISDDSEIKIQTVSSKLQLASARQGFSSYSVTAAMDTSALSLGASGSAGYASSSKTASSSTSGKENMQMHASYNFPRVRLFLDEDSLSLSPDCITALTAIKTSKSYSGVLEFYQMFGHLFVTRAKVGGCLRAIQHLTADEKSDMASTEDAWKASLAASFSTDTTSGKATSSAQNASSTQSKSASSNLNTSIAWEAVGGDTTMGNNPSNWCTTVDNSWFWRVVEQEVVVPIEDIISKLTGYEDTKALFSGIMLDHLMRATPMEIPWNGGGTVALGGGISSTATVLQPGDIMRQCALQATAAPNIPIPRTPDDVQWNVIHNEPSMQSYLKQTFSQTINAFVGTRLYPNQVWRLGTSDRAFSVVLRARAGLQRSTATFTVPSTTQATDPAAWQSTFGDFYIRSFVTGSELSVCWTFISQTRSAELEQARASVAALFSTPMPLESGCNFLARLGMTFPCTAYLYDAWYQETVLCSPTAVLTTIQKLQKSPATQQTISIDLAPYIGIEELQDVAASAVSSPVPSSALDVVRQDEAAYAYEASQWQTQLSIVSPTSTSFTTGQQEFSSATYSSTVQSPSTNSNAATGLVQNYNNLFSRATTVVVPQSPVWPAVYGTNMALQQATLQYLRQSRQEELATLSQPISTSTSTIFGFSTQPAAPAPTHKPPPPPQTPVQTYSLRTAYINNAHLESQIDLEDHGEGLDGMWDYVTDSTKYPSLGLPDLPAQVVAYQMVAYGTSPSSLVPPGSVVQLNVGMDLVEFAQMRSQNTNLTPDWVVYDLWVVYGALRFSDIAG